MMILRTYNSQPMSLANINFLHLIISEIYPGQDFIGPRSLRQGQRSNQGHTMTLHTDNSQQMSYQVSTSYTLQSLRYSPEKIL